MDKLKVVVLGDGLLGSEIIRQTGWDYISRKKGGFDIDNIESFKSQLLEYDVIINCIANTNTYEGSKEDHWKVNYKFVYDLIQFCNQNGIKLVQISTTYLYSGSKNKASEEDVPVHCDTWYGYTKLLSDGIVQLLSQNYLLIRCTHKPNPFPYKKAWVNQIGNFDYVDRIAEIIIRMTQENANGVYNVGTDLKSIYILAQKTQFNVDPIPAPDNAPKNISSDNSKMETFLKDHPFFSIAIPAYGYDGKGSEYLEFNFKKLEIQKFKDFEVVVSDHSIDNTILSLCESWKSRLNIKYIKNDRGRGVISPNLNEAMKHSKGRWIKILFQDDFLYDENSLEITYQFILDNPKSKWISTTFCHSNDGVDRYRVIIPKWHPDMVYGHNSMGCPSGISIKNENLIFFDEELNWLMDCEYYKRMHDLYGEAIVIDKVTVVNRTNSNRLSNTIPEDIRLKEYEKIYKIYGR